MGKTNGSRAYLNFKQETKPIVEERVGRTVAEKEFDFCASQEWKGMTREQRALYAPSRTNNRLDSYGVLLSVYDEIDEQERKTKEDMENGIRDMIDQRVTGHAMRELEVVVVVVTEYIPSAEDEVIPAEVSLVRLTLGGGLDPKQYHDIIKPPPAWPLGFAHMARVHSNSTHCLPVDRRDCVGTDSLDEVAAEMVAFLTQEDGSARLSPVFTLGERLKKTRILLREIFGMEFVDVWCLENLLRAAFEALYPERSRKYSINDARNDLVNSPQSPDHHPALGCKWHREERQDEVNHCSLNMAQRWGFMLLNALNVESSLGVTLVAGLHWPGPYSNRAEVTQLSKHQTRNVRRHGTRMQASDATGEAASDTGTKTGIVAGSRADSVANNALSLTSRREKTWQEIEDGSKTPVLQCSEEFPSLGGGRKQPPKGNGWGGASGSSREAYGGPNTARNKACGAVGGVSIRNAAACLVAKNNDSSGKRQQGAAARSRGGRGGLSDTAQMEEQLRHINLNDDPSGTGESWQPTLGEELKKKNSKKHGRGRKK